MEDNRWVVAIVASDCGVISSLIDQVRYSADSTAPRSHTPFLASPPYAAFPPLSFLRYLPALSLCLPFSRPVSLQHALQLATLVLPCRLINDKGGLLRSLARNVVSTTTSTYLLSHRYQPKDALAVGSVPTCVAYHISPSKRVRFTTFNGTIRLYHG